MQINEESKLKISEQEYEELSNVSGGFFGLGSFSNALLTVSQVCHDIPVVPGLAEGAGRCLDVADKVGNVGVFALKVINAVAPNIDPDQSSPKDPGARLVCLSKKIVQWSKETDKNVKGWIDKNI